MSIFLIAHQHIKDQLHAAMAQWLETLDSSAGNTGSLGSYATGGVRKGI